MYVLMQFEYLKLNKKFVFGTFILMWFGMSLALVAQSCGTSDVEILKNVVNGDLMITKKTKLMPVSEELESKNTDIYIKLFTTLYEPI